MRYGMIPLTLIFALLIATGCERPHDGSDPSGGARQMVPSAPAEADAVQPVVAPGTPAPLDLAKAQSEVTTRYAAAHPEIQEYVLWTARTFGPGRMWLNEDAYAGLSDAEREERIEYLATLLSESEYGRHLCAGLAEAGALKDERLIPGLMKQAGYHRDDADYDCRAKWIAVASLARQDSEQGVPLLISLVDHGNQNTRNWARAALARLTGQDLGQDKQAWAQWWQAQGHPPLDPALLKPFVPPPAD